jgi:hypothetical protein
LIPKLLPNSAQTHWRATIAPAIMSGQNPSTAYAFSPTSSPDVALPPQALLSQLLPYASQTASILLSSIIFLGHALGFLISKISYPIFVLSPLPIILYLVSPAIVFVEVVLDMLVSTPYRISLYLLDAFYPVYVFCGVACIVGAFLGIGGRVVAGILVGVVEGPVMPPSRHLEQGDQERYRK